MDLGTPVPKLFGAPGAPFGPVHFTKYPSNPACSEVNLETSLLADPLAQTRIPEQFNCEAVRDKCSYLPTHLVPITPLITFHHPPPRPQGYVVTIETTATQVFRVLYITLTGMMGYMVLSSGPWSILRCSWLHYQSGTNILVAWPTLVSAILTGILTPS
ncbi:hypothetical protein DSO57_1004438 [Entomophthora muscae]|uniref:Uncharacterized protein n=1 Tax=Entomophthora muscae TaxID=34485 RepID=A0ACC2TJI2_9FUNG|nr:hypothetical protein DSO57_1004438 [Entomophthora muscae]